jgi:cobalt/nickel transport system permease protein
MHIHFLDPYRPRASPIHNLDPRAKFILTLAFILTTALTPIAAWPVYILLFSIILSVEILSGLGVGFVLKRAALALPFALAALPVLFTIKGTELFRLPAGVWVLIASVEGLERFVSVALKSWLSVQAAIVLAASTPFPDLLQAMRAVRIPRLLVAMFGLMWRYLFVLVDEALRLMRARAARSGAVDRPACAHATGRPGVRKGGSVAWRARVTGGMAGNLFLRAFERSDRIYMAMVARGYDGEVRSLPQTGMSGGGKLTLASGLVVMVVLLLLGFFFQG